MHFGENQLSRSLIGLSPLPTAHPPGFQPWWVRASTRSYPRFTLAMGRSPRFGSTPRDSTPSSDSLSLRLPHTRVNLATQQQLAGSFFKRHAITQHSHALTDCRHTVSGTLSLPSRGTFHHSLTVLSTIGHQEVFRLSEWSRQIHNALHGNAATREHNHTQRMHFRLRDSHPLRPGIPTCSTSTHTRADGLADPSSHAPQHRTRNPCQVSHAHGLASSAFARHYSRNHQCFLFLRVLRCFTSPRSPSHPIHSGMSDATSLAPGFPIRTSSDHSSVDNSPRHIAASHVLHRPLVPRHPPCALHNLATKMLASTIQFSNNNHTEKHPHHTHDAACPLRHPTAYQQPTP